MILWQLAAMIMDARSIHKTQKWKKGYGLGSGPHALRRETEARLAVEMLQELCYYITAICGPLPGTELDCNRRWVGVPAPQRKVDTKTEGRDSLHSGG